MEKIGMVKLKRYIRRMNKKYGYNYGGINFLGFVENRDLTSEVESYFKVIVPSGHTYYDWVHGNERMKDLLESMGI